MKLNFVVVETKEKKSSCKECQPGVEFHHHCQMKKEMSEYFMKFNFSASYLSSIFRLPKLMIKNIYTQNHLIFFPCRCKGWNQTNGKNTQKKKAKLNGRYGMNDWLVGWYGAFTFEREWMRFLFYSMGIFGWYKGSESQTHKDKIKNRYSCEVREIFFIFS